MAFISLKFRLYPKKSQVKKLEQTLEECRWLYNHLLNERKTSWENEKKSLSFYDQGRQITTLKKEKESLKTINAQVLENVANRIDLAFKGFFRRIKTGEKPGYPRFKGKNQYDSITYRQYGYKINANSISLSKIGEIKAVIHRPIEGKVKTCTIRRHNGKWFACLSVEVETQPLPKTNSQIGIDLGVEKFAALSEGTFIDNPKFFKQEEKALAKAQRKLSKQKKGLKERANAKKVVRKIHDRISNKRHNFLHQTARKIINEHDVIVVEKLDVQNMQQDNYTSLNKSISDASWCMFRQILTQKAESAARKLILVNPAYTSQDCSGCGNRAKKPLKERWHFCPNCGLSLDRDTNAAINILRLGLQSLNG